MLAYNRKHAHEPHLQIWVPPEKISDDDTSPRSPSPIHFTEPTE